MCRLHYIHFRKAVHHYRVLTYSWCTSCLLRWHGGCTLKINFCIDQSTITSDYFSSMVWDLSGQGKHWNSIQLCNICWTFCFLACLEDVRCCVYSSSFNFAPLLNYRSSWARPIICRHDHSVVTHYTRLHMYFLMRIEARALIKSPSPLKVLYVSINIHMQYCRVPKHQGYITKCSQHFITNNCFQHLLPTPFVNVSV